MKGRIRRLPSPSMAVAFIALLAALGGTAVALPGRNTVTADDIKKGAATTSEIRNNTVRTQDIRNGTIRGKDVRNNSLTGADITRIRGGDVSNNSLTGADINETTLGKVASAGAADRATSAGAVDGRTPFLVKLAAGESRTIASNGAVSIVADCATGASDVVRILGATAAGGSAQGGSDSYDGSAGDTLEPTTAAGDRVILTNSATPGTTEVSWNIDSGWVMASDGRSISIDGETTALGLNYAGAKCVASGVVNAAG